MAAADVMDGEVVRRWFRLAADALGATRAAIDAINVFPVPDADTGTNLHATIVCAADAIAELPPEAGPAEIWQAAATGALRGACGNSGIIVSQLLRGLADICAPAVPCDGGVVATALRHAAAAARAAVHRPVEGTVLTVADAAAEAAARVSSLADVGRAAALGARAALTRTQQQLQALAVNGVVDAGAAGLCIVLDALSAAISGTPPGGYDVPQPAGGHLGSPAELAASALAAAGVSPRAAAHAYEVTFLLDAPEQAVSDLRDRLDVLGDSLVVSGSDGQWHAHVHVADAGAVIESGLVAGRLSKITITYLNAPADGAAACEPAADEPDQDQDQPWVPPAGRIIVAAQGRGLARVLSDAGAIVIGAAPGAEPAEVLAQVARLLGPMILISQVSTIWPSGWPLIEIGSAVQAIAALAVHDPDREMYADAAVMVRAVAGMRYASVSAGAWAPARVNGSIRADGAAPPTAASGTGFVGRIGDEVVTVGADQGSVARTVIDLLLAQGAELVTLLTGHAAEPGLGELAAARAAAAAPAAEIACYDGGMTGAVLLIGAE